jgi:hypothetical protein
VKLYRSSQEALVENVVVHPEETITTATGDIERTITETNNNGMESKESILVIEQ